MALEDEFENREAFERIYDLPDPAPYYAAMRTLDYRMPSVASGYLKHAAPALCETFGKSVLRVLDFACGYGTNGAQLTHDLTLMDLYGYYGDGARRPPKEPADWQADAAFFRDRRQPAPSFEVGGVDIAATAVRYAQHVGAISQGFAVDLTSADPAPDLDAFLAGTDVVMESGAIGTALPAAYDRLLSSVPAKRQPWLLIATRPDVDSRPLQAVLDRHGMIGACCNETPFRYRRMIGPSEHATMTADIARLGNDPATYIVDGYLMVDLMLYRPQPHADDPRLREVTADIPPAVFSGRDG